MLNKQTSENYLAELKQLILHHLEGLDVKVYLYGSRAKGTARPTSDVDIALLPLNTLPAGCLSTLVEKIETSHIPYTVDVVNLNETSESFKEKIIQEGVPWKE